MMTNEQAPIAVDMTMVRRDREVSIRRDARISERATRQAIEAETYGKMVATAVSANDLADNDAMG